jgi:hypothetical protein
MGGSCQNGREEGSQKKVFNGNFHNMSWKIKKKTGGRVQRDAL